jgi:hypothetical protein
VAAPDDGGALRGEWLDQPGRLRIVDDHHVALAHAVLEVLQVLRQHPLVRRAGGVVERETVTRHAVQAVVDALGDREELRRSLDHRPARVHAGAACVRDQRLQQLDHAAAACGGVHVPDDPPVEQRARLLGARLEGLDLLF